MRGTPLSKKKSQTAKTPRKGKACPQCNGKGIVVEMCNDCQGHGCLECDGQGYIAWGCETCGDPENRRTPLVTGERQGKKPAEQRYPSVLDPDKVGTYSVLCKSGGGTLFQAVLEYRVWAHETRGDDKCHFFDSYDSAKRFSTGRRGAEAPLALVLQNPWIQWNGEKRDFELVYEDRVAEWCVEWLIESSRDQNAEVVIAKLRAEYHDGVNE